MDVVTSPVPPVAASQYWEPYNAHSGTFRTWMMAYGIAVPYLFVSQKDFTALLQPNPLTAAIIIIFFGGVVTQLLVLLYSKYLMMALYTGEAVIGYKDTWWYRFCDRASEKTWPFVATDLGTIAIYLTGTVLLFNALMFKVAPSTPDGAKVVVPAGAQPPKAVETAKPARGKVDGS